MNIHQRCWFLFLTQRTISVHISLWWFWLIWEEEFLWLLSESRTNIIEIFPPLSLYFSSVDYYLFKKCVFLLLFIFILRNGLCVRMKMFGRVRESRRARTSVYVPAYLYAVCKYITSHKIESYLYKWNSWQSVPGRKKKLLPWAFFAHMYCVKWLSDMLAIDDLMILSLLFE